jgi:hypothetical protein
MDVDYPPQAQLQGSHLTWRRLLGPFHLLLKFDITDFPVCFPIRSILQPRRMNTCYSISTCSAYYINNTDQLHSFILRYIMSLSPDTSIQLLYP